MEFICNGVSAGRYKFSTMFREFDIVKAAAGWNELYDSESISIPVSVELFTRAVRSLKQGIPDWEALDAMGANIAIAEVLETYQTPDELRQEMNELPRYIFYLGARRFTDEGTYLVCDEDGYSIQTPDDMFPIASLDERYPVTGLIIEVDSISVNELNKIYQTYPNIFEIHNEGRALIPTFLPTVVQYTDERLRFDTMPYQVVSFTSSSSFPDNFNFPSLRNLEVLTINGEQNLSKALQNISHLRELNVHNFDPDDIRSIVAHHPHIETLILQGEIPIPVDRLELLAENLKNLQSIIVIPTVELTEEDRNRFSPMFLRMIESGEM